MLKSRHKPYFVGGQLADVERGQALALAGAGDLKIIQSPEMLTGASTATTSASINTKGSSYTQMYSAAALTSDAYALQLTLPNNNFSRDVLCDIATGGAGSETNVLNNILISCPKSAGRRPVSCIWPIFIPRGTRISARAQSTTGSTSQEVWITPILRNPFPRIYRTCETMGAATGDSGGTSIDPGGSANTEGGWIELIASTTRRIRLLTLVFGNQLNAARSDYTWLMDIAVGGAGSEVAILNDIFVIGESSSDFITPLYYALLPVDIPAGSRVSARTQCTGTDATDRLIDVVAYGFAP